MVVSLASVLITPTRGAYFLPFRLRFAASAFAVNATFYFPQSLDVGRRPKTNRSASPHNDLRRFDFTGTNPALKRNPIDADCFGCFRGRDGRIHTTCVAYLS